MRERRYNYYKTRQFQKRRKNYLKAQKQKQYKTSNTSNRTNSDKSIVKIIGSFIYEFFISVVLAIYYILLGFYKAVKYTTTLLGRIFKTLFSKNKKTKILLAHDNRTPLHTTKAHRLAKSIENNPDFEVIYDQKIWRKGEQTSFSENQIRERNMVEESDVIVRIVPNPMKTGTPRNKGAVREIQEAVRQNKPIIEIHESDAKESKYKPKSEKLYTKREAIFLKPNERLAKTLKLGMKRLKRKKQI